MISRTFRPVVLASLAALTHPATQAQPTTSGAPGAEASPFHASVVALVQRPDESAGEFNLPSTPLALVIAPLEDLTGRTVLRQQGLPNPEINLVFRTPPTRAEAMQALESVLNLNQIAIVPLGEKFLKLVPMQTVRMESPELIEGSALALPPSGRVASKLFALEFLRVNEFVPQIAPLLNANIGNYALFEKTNSVLITDSVANLQRIEGLLSRLDRPSLSAMATRFYSLRFAKASDLVNRLRTILQGPLQSQLSSATSYTPDDRTNQIILVSDPRQFDLFDELIQKLDVKADPNTRNEVVYLKNASSKDVAPLLTNIVTGQSKALQSDGAKPITLTAPAQPGAAPAATANIQTATGSGQEFSSFVTIQYDERSNALILSGTVDDIRMLRELINKIDIVLPQVLIEVVIAEVTLSDSKESGLNALSLTASTTNGVTSISGFSGTVSGWGVTEGVVDPTAFKATMASLGGNSNVKILSRPTIMTTHNKEGKVTVGQKQPIITSTTSTPITSTTTSSSFATQQSVTYQDIAIELQVTPLIGEDGTIQLKIKQKVDDVVGDPVSINGNDQPIIGHREAESYVTVRDGGMVVLGGLQRVKNSRSRSKLGLLFEVPVVSHLLGGRKKSEERTELLVFVRPKVVSLDGASANVEEKINQLSNGENVRQFVEDPSKPLKEPLKEKIK